MIPLVEREIRSSFVNCSKGEASRLNLPRDLRELEWESLDFLGWRDQQSPERGYLVAEHNGRLTGIVMRFPQGVKRSVVKTTVCSVCVTSHGGTGVALFVAPRVGAAGRQGNTVGAYLCSDLACSLYIRGRKATDRLSGSETLSLEDRIARLVLNLDDFVAKVLA
ncbi:FBP domain-containing protein [Herbidospora yilanensis]|uniref:FBP domain-containing protein n=1 Tax=Herbidospora yilanensis TaxID=354426 RepID=UPI000782EC4E|nr:FBP domain-containing protein [Herbidospora yilanensis]